MSLKKCLLFDNDGTLVDSEFLNCEAMAAELSDTGINEDPEHLYRTYSGWQLSLVLDDLQKHHAMPLDDGFIARFRRRASLHFEGRLQAVVHIPQVLAQLDNPMCVASNAPMEKILQAINLTGLASFFGESIFSAYDINSWKPEPDLFLHAAREMGFDPSQCVVIEDSEVGVTAALAAGIDVVQFDPHFSTRPRAGVAVIHSMKELPDAIQSFS